MSDNKDMRELDMDELVNVIGGEMTPKEKDYITALIRRLKKTAKPKNMSKAYEMCYVSSCSFFSFST